MEFSAFREVPCKKNQPSNDKLINLYSRLPKFREFRENLPEFLSDKYTIKLILELTRFVERFNIRNIYEDVSYIVFHSDDIITTTRDY